MGRFLEIIGGEDVGPEVEDELPGGAWAVGQLQLLQLAQLDQVRQAGGRQLGTPWARLHHLTFP